MSVKKKERLAWIDYARTFAILCVIIVHSTEAVYPINVETLTMLVNHSSWIVISLFTLGRLGVPIFLFISGYLLLDKEYDDKGIRNFYRHNFCPLLITTELWILIYGLFTMWYTSSPFNFKDVVKDVLFFRLCDMSHMWYMPMILGIYLWLPLMAKVVRTSNIRYVEVLSGFAFIILFCLPVINVFRDVAGKSLLNSYIDMGCSGGIYGMMLLFGYYVKKGEFDSVPTPLISVTGIASFGLTVYTQYYSNAHGVNYAVWYNSASLVICSLAVFILLARLSLKRNRLIEQISILSFGIYLIHNMVLKVLLHYLSYNVTMLKIGIIMVLTFLITYGIVYIISCFKISKHLLLIKK